MLFCSDDQMSAIGDVCFCVFTAGVLDSLLR